MGSVGWRRGLLIRGGTVVDGTGGPPVRADVRVTDGLVAEIGPSLRAAGEVELDAGDCFVTPGFIDSHTHFDAGVFWDPLCDPMTLHGVTTVIIGNCSLSLAPVAPADRHRLSELFAYIEDIPARVLADGVPWTWETYREYLADLGRGGLGVNVASLVGHSMLRHYVIGEAAWDRPATPAELRILVAALDECLSNGAFGLSISLFDEDASKRPVPSRVADEAELAALLQALGSRRRVLSFIPNVARHDAMMRDVDRMAVLCRRVGVTAVWNGLFHDERRPERSVEVLEQAARLQHSSALVYPQVSPRRLDIRVNWAGGMAFYSLEPWHRVVQAPPDLMAGLLEDPGWRGEARKAWDELPRTLLRHRELDRLRLVSVTQPENEPWLGATLGDLVQQRGGHPSDVLADWVLANDLNPGIVGEGVANGDPDGVAQLLGHDAVVVANSDAGAHVQMMCGAGDTTLLLTRHVRDRGDFSIERAVWELTGRPAAVFGVGGRGVLAAGCRADLAVFDLDALRWRPEVLVADLPGGVGRLRRPPGGYRHTIVGGVPVQEDGQPTGALPGIVVRAG